MSDSLVPFLLTTSCVSPSSKRSEIETCLRAVVKLLLNKMKDQLGTFQHCSQELDCLALALVQRWQTRASVTWSRARHLRTTRAAAPHRMPGGRRTDPQAQSGCREQLSCGTQHGEHFFLREHAKKGSSHQCLKRRSEKMGKRASNKHSLATTAAY